MTDWSYVGKAWIVHPDDPDINAEYFISPFLAEEWAAGLCCSYWIEEV